MAIFVAVVTVLGLITVQAVVSLRDDNGQRRLKRTVLVEEIVVVHDGFFEDVDGHR